jgi:hypothetical protein
MAIRASTKRSAPSPPVESPRHANGSSRGGSQAQAAEAFASAGPATRRPRETWSCALSARPQAGQW